MTRTPATRPANDGFLFSHSRIVTFWFGPLVVGIDFGVAISTQQFTVAWVRKEPSVGRGRRRFVIRIAKHDTSFSNR